MKETFRLPSVGFGKYRVVETRGSQDYFLALNFLQVVERMGAVYVVIQFKFYPWYNFYFPLFLSMVMYNKEYKTKENKN